MEEVLAIDKTLYHETINNESSAIALIWNKIKDNELILRRSYTLVYKNHKVTILAPTIAEYILKYLKGTKEFDELQDIIISNKEIGRLGCTDGGTFLRKLVVISSEFNSEQKRLIVKEAMNSLGTRSTQSASDLENNVKKEPISRNVDGLPSFHGKYPLDLRFCILISDAFTIKEKLELIYKFYLEYEDWDYAINRFKKFIVFNLNLFDDNGNQLLDEKELFNYSYDDLFHILGSEIETELLYAKIQDLKMMVGERPLKEDVKKTFRLVK